MSNIAYYKGRSGRGSKIKATQRGSGKKRITIRARGRTRVKVA